MDPTTGTIDMDLIQTGFSAGDRTARAQLTKELHALIQRKASLFPLYLPPSSAKLYLIDDAEATQVDRAECS